MLAIIESELSRIVRSLEDDELRRAVLLLSYFEEFVPFIEADQLERLRSFIQRMTTDDLDIIDEALSIGPLKALATNRISRLSLEEIQGILFFALPEVVGDRLIELLQKSKSFDTTNELCAEIRKNLREFTKRQLTQIVEVGSENEQVEYAFDHTTRQ